MNIMTLWKIWRAGAYIYNLAKPYLARRAVKKDLEALPERDLRWEEKDDQIDFIFLSNAKNASFHTECVGAGKFKYLLAGEIPATHPLYTPTEKDRWGVTWFYDNKENMHRLFVCLTKPGLVMTKASKTIVTEQRRELTALAAECRKALAFPKFNGIVRFGFTNQVSGSGKTLDQLLTGHRDLEDWVNRLDGNALFYMLVQDETSDYPELVKLEVSEVTLGIGTVQPMILKFPALGKTITLYPNAKLRGNALYPAMGREYTEVYRWMEPTAKVNHPVVHDLAVRMEQALNDEITMLDDLPSFKVP